MNLTFVEVDRESIELIANETTKVLGIAQIHGESVYECYKYNPRSKQWLYWNTDDEEYNVIKYTEFWIECNVKLFIQE